MSGSYSSRKTRNNRHNPLKPSFQLPNQPLQMQFMSDNKLKVSWNSLTISKDVKVIIHTLPLSYLPHRPQWGLHLGMELISSPSLTCSVPGGCSIFADAPRSAEADVGDANPPALTPETPSSLP